MRLIVAAVLALGTLSVTSAEIDFSHEIVPILRKRCFECHGGGKSKGGFSINSREEMLKPDADGAAEGSVPVFLQLARSGDSEERMPPKDKPRLTDEEVVRLVAWVDAGMP